MASLKLQHILEGVERCPQCNVAHPLLTQLWKSSPTSVEGSKDKQLWAAYQCSKCERITLAEGHPAPLVAGKLHEAHWLIIRLHPSERQVADTLPDEARRYLKQAIDTLFAPDASVVMAASAVDAMLRNKGYAKGSLYERIGTAVDDHILTEDMGTWAHQVRLEANAVRHVDKVAPPTREDAERIVEFASALGDFLYVFAARVEKGVEASAPG
jgi:hypothetical protein